MAAPEFLRYDRNGEIVDVDEFNVAKAIFAGDMQALSQEVESQHLFELCLAFGHQSTAALLTQRVPGCRLEAWHLGPFADPADPEEFWSCRCGSTWRTCKYCCWGSAVEAGQWMKDWDAKLADAVACAHAAVARPVAHAAFAALRSGQHLCNLQISEGAMARLLDLAVLTGDVELAQHCAKHGLQRPLRRWRSQDLFDDPVGPLVALADDVMQAAILTGADLQGLHVGIDWWGRLDDDCIPLREAVALCGDLQLWQRLVPLLPESKDRWIPKMLDSELLLWPSASPDWTWEICMPRLRTAVLANLDLARFEIIDGYREFMLQRCPCGFEKGQGYARDCPNRLLDAAVSCGQSDCAELLASRGCVSKWTREACLPYAKCGACGKMTLAAAGPAPLEERRRAAGVALRAALARARQLAAPMGLGVYQALLAWGHGKKVPPALVDMILPFAAERPDIARVLQGLEAELLQAASATLRSAEQPPRTSETSGAPTQAHEVQADPVYDYAPEAQEGPDVKSTDDVLTAVRNSKAEPAPLSLDGVIAFKLRRKANAPHVNELLFDPEGPLAELHRRVLDAGCEVVPDWSPVKALFVPCTLEQFLELTDDRHSVAEMFLCRFASSPEPDMEGSKSSPCRPAQHELTIIDHYHKLCCRLCVRTYIET